MAKYFFTILILGLSLCLSSCAEQKTVSEYNTFFDDLNHQNIQKHTNSGLYQSLKSLYFTGKYANEKLSKIERLLLILNKEEMYSNISELCYQLDKSFTEMSKHPVFLGHMYTCFSSYIIHLKEPRKFNNILNHLKNHEPYSHMMRSDFLLKKNKLPEALRTLLSIKSKNADTYFAIANLYMLQSNYKSAALILKQGIKDKAYQENNINFILYSYLLNPISFNTKFWDVFYSEKVPYPYKIRYLLVYQNAILTANVQYDLSEINSYIDQESQHFNKSYLLFEDRVASLQNQLLHNENYFKNVHVFNTNGTINFDKAQNKSLIYEKFLRESPYDEYVLRAILENIMRFDKGDCALLHEFSKRIIEISEVNKAFIKPYEKKCMIQQKQKSLGPHTKPKRKSLANHKAFYSIKHAPLMWAGWLLLVFLLE